MTFPDAASCNNLFALSPIPCAPMQALLSVPSTPDAKAFRLSTPRRSAIDEISPSTMYLPDGCGDMSRFLLNIAKRSLLRLMLGGIGLASKNAA